MTDAAILTTLIPGSVWRKETVKKGKTRVSESVVLAISNQDLSEALLERFPPQVVFITDRGQLLTQGVDTFVATRNYVTINEGVVAAMAQVQAQAFGEDDEVEDFDQVSLDQPAGGLTEAAAQLAETIGLEPSDSEDAAPNYPFQLTNTAHELNDVLVDSFVSYTEAPWATGEVMHTLKFGLADVALEDLEAVFVKEQLPFQLVSWGTLVDLTSAKPVSVGLAIQGSQAYGLVYLLTEKPVSQDLLAEEHGLEIVEDAPEGDVIDVNATPVQVQATDVVNVATAQVVTAQPTPVTAQPVAQVVAQAQPAVGTVTIVG
jgi:hypothetical protein